MVIWARPGFKKQTEHDLCEMEGRKANRGRGPEDQKQVDHDCFGNFSGTGNTWLGCLFLVAKNGGSSQTKLVGVV